MNITKFIYNKRMTNFITHLIRRFNHYRLPLNLKHLAKYHPGFHLANHPEEPTKKIILWHNREVGTTKSVKNLKALQKQDCYIIATGPSIKELDLSKIPAKSAICGVNGAITLAKKHNIKFDFYVIVDADFIRKRFDMVKDIIKSRTQLLLSSQNISLICEREPELLRDANIYILDDLNTRYNTASLDTESFAQWAEQDPELILNPKILAQDLVGFSKNITKGIFGGGTVVFGAIQAVYYIGFKRVFILGMDLGSNGNQRCYDEGKKPLHSSLDKYYDDIIEPAFKVLAQLCNIEDFKVYNLSPVSRLPDTIIPKLVFDTVQTHT